MCYSYICGGRVTSTDVVTGYLLTGEACACGMQMSIVPYVVVAVVVDFFFFYRLHLIVFVETFNTKKVLDEAVVPGERAVLRSHGFAHCTRIEYVC